MLPASITVPLPVLKTADHSARIYEFSDAETFAAMANPPDTPSITVAFASLGKPPPQLLILFANQLTI
jgi:hypothetical protein